MATGISEARTSQQPKSVLIFLPGTMQAFFDQSIGLVARQITNACNHIIGTPVYTPGNIEEVRFTSGGSIQKTRVMYRNEPQQDIVVISANYTEMLSESLKQSCIVMRFWRLFRFWFGVLPLMYRILTKTPPRGHTRLSPAQKGFLIGAYFLVLVAVTVATVAVAKVAGGEPKLLVLLTMVIAGLVPRKLATATLSIGNEYYGLSRYLLKADKRDEIKKYLADVFKEVRNGYPTAEIHIACFSFGCVVGFNHFFARGVEPEIEASSLTFIGFPYILIDAGAPEYFSGRQWHKGRIERWRNLYVADDVLGSKVTNYLVEIFGQPNDIPLEEKSVAAQCETVSWLNPITRHMAYWDPKADDPCEAMQIVAGTILAAAHQLPRGDGCVVRHDQAISAGRRSPMGIRVLEIHHHAVRIDSEPPKLEAVQKFYKNVLGLEADPGRPKIPGVPGFWINVGEGGQIHLIGGEQPSPLAKAPGQDPTIPHVALAVADIQETKAELDRLNVSYWSMTGINGPTAEQIFINDPSGNMVELHQVDQCRCRIANRV